jgi:hypothetical protein
MTGGSYAYVGKLILGSLPSPLGKICYKEVGQQVLRNKQQVGVQCSLTQPVHAQCLPS